MGRENRIRNKLMETGQEVKKERRGKTCMLKEYKIRLVCE